jgi:hypothetical protein
MQYQKFIEERFRIVDKDRQEVPYQLNNWQSSYINIDSTGKDIILKPRKVGFSSVILARYASDFLLQMHSRSVVIADNTENGIALLDRVKFYLKTYEAITKMPVPLKYNSKHELVNEVMNSRYFVGTAENAEFGRSQDITNLHFSEAAFYPHFDRLRASALQATTNNAHVVVETTANGFNDFKSFWDKSVLGETGFKPLFYKASDFYLQEFLEQKKKELQERFLQEYPETPEDAFLTSGESFFNKEALRVYMTKTRDPFVQRTI